MFDLNSANRYTYVEDDPVNQVDPSGASSWWDFFSQCVLLPVTGIIALVGAVLGSISTLAASIYAILGVTTVPIWVAWAGLIGAILFLGVTAFCVGFATESVIQLG